MASPAAVLAILVEANTTQANAALAKTQAQLRATEATATKSTGVMAARLKTFGKTAGLAAAAAGVAATKMALDYEEALLKVRNLSGASKKDVEEWGKAILSMAPKVGKSPQELADALYFVASAGIKTKDVLDTVKTAAEASAVGLGETEIVADALTSAMNAYAKEGLSAADATNVLLKTVKFGKLEADELAQSIGRVIPVASKLKVPFADVGASLAVMSLSGLDAAESTTALRGIFTALIKPTDEGQKALEKVGLSYGELQKMSKGPGGILNVLQTLGEKFQGNSAAMAKLFPNVRGLVGVFNILGNNQEKVNDIFEGTEKNTDDLGKAMERLRKSPAFKLQQAWAFIQAQLIKLGDVILDVAFNKIPKIVDALKDFWNESAIFRTAMRTIWGITKKTWSAIKDIFQAGAQVIGGIVKVISGLLTLRFGRAWDGVKDIFSGGVKLALGVLRAMTAPVREIGQRIGDALMNAFRAAAEGIVKIFGWLKGKIIGIFNDIKNAIGDALTWIQNAVNDALVELGLKDKIEITAPAGPRGTTVGPPGTRGVVRQRGGVIPGVGSGDKVPAMLEPGEFVLNKRAVQGLGRARVEAMNKAMPRFASGGMVGLKPGISRLAKFATDRYGLGISSGLRPGTGSFHNTGEAVDLVPPSMKATQGIFNAFKSQLEELFYDPWGGWDSGHMIGAIGGHMDHIHAAILGAGGPAGLLKKIGRVRFSGSGPLSKIAQASTDRVTKAANRFLGKQSVSTPHVGGGAMNLGDIAQLWTSVNHGLGDPNLMARIAMAESSGNPSAIGHDPGGTTGYGLWQITSGFHDDLIRKYGGTTGILNPKNNALAAASILRSEGVGAWAASGPWQEGGMVPWFGKGADFVANNPMKIGVGDGGHERVTITPMSGGQTAPEPPVVNVTVNVEAGSGADILGDRISHEIESAMSGASSHARQIGRQR